jgi:hypothetical protein
VDGDLHRGFDSDSPIDPTGGIIWQKNKLILPGHEFIIDRNAIEVTYNLFPSLSP